ncbi:MAG: hypothetical protein KAT48_14930 [Bacteroidales bacterium]|nr:hypothetical protein [Bacteroidales bacterium]
MRNLLSITLILCCACHLSFGQTINKLPVESYTDNLIENVILHTDRDIYLSGEELWFTAYITMNNILSDSTLSTVLYIELYNNKATICKKKFVINDGLAMGAFNIPEETRSGNYFLRAYTQYLRNAPPETYFRSLVTIINPEIPLPANEQALKQETTIVHEKVKLSKKPNDNLKINITTSKKTYQPRELIGLELNHTPGINNELTYLSVSVIKHGTKINDESLHGGLIIDTLHPDPYPKKLSWVPEIRGVSISGLIRKKNSLQPELNTKIYISVLGENPQFHITKTDENGKFIFALNQATNIEDIFLCTKHRFENDLEFLINNDFSSTYPVINDIPFLIDTSYKGLLEEMYINYQTKIAFDVSHVDISKKSSGMPFIWGLPENSILLDDFIELPTLKDVFNEIIPFVRVRSQKGTHYLSVLDPLTKETFNAPLILLDNLPVFDIDELLKIHPARIKQIDVINRTYLLGEYNIKGIVLITSTTDDFCGISFPKESIFVEFQTITPTLEFQSPIYDTETKKLSRIPDFRTTLYWYPNLILQQQDTALSFFASDHCSEYDVIVRGITNEGIPCFGKASFRVSR